MLKASILKLSKRFFSLIIVLILESNFLIAPSLLTKVYADGPVPGNDCVWMYPSWFAGYRCFIRGYFNSYNVGSFTHRIQYSGGQNFYFTTSNPTYVALTGQEVIIDVTFTDNINYIINQFVNYSTYNVAPNQPNLINPQSNWDLGPRTNGTFTGVNCNTAGTGAGCSIDFNVDINDPDDTPPINSFFEITNTSTGSNQNTSLSGEGNQTFTRTLNDGNWQWRGHTTDKYNADSGYTSYRTNIRVDTTAPSQPALNAEPTFSPGNSNTLTSSISTDNLIGGIQYKFEIADDALFTINPYSPGFVTSNSQQFTGLTDNKTYHYRVRAKDSLDNTTAWSSIVSSTQDAILPTLSNLTVSELKISPQNQDADKDNSQIDFDWSELNASESKIQILDTSNNLIKEFSENTSSNLSGSGHTTWIWDGKDNAGIPAYVSDATYNVKIILTDKAGNQSIDNSQYIIIDNSPATLNVNQADGSWYKENTLNVSGQTENNAALQIKNNSTNEIQNPTPHPITGLFGSGSPTPAPLDPLITFNLNNGENDFTFKATDSVGNSNTINRKYFFENISPTLNISTPLNNSLTKNTRPPITLNLSDTGFNSYISGIDKDKIQLFIKHGSDPELQLITNGVANSSIEGTYEQILKIINKLPIIGKNRAFLIIKSLGGNIDDVMKYLFKESNDLVWLEKGNSSSGWLHILENHYLDFAYKIKPIQTFFPKIPFNELKEVIMDVVKTTTKTLDNGSYVYIKEVEFSNNVITKVKVVTTLTGRIITSYPLP